VHEKKQIIQAENDLVQYINRTDVEESEREEYDHDEGYLPDMEGAHYDDEEEQYGYDHEYGVYDDQEEYEDGYYEQGGYNVILVDEDGQFLEEAYVVYDDDR
jgi:hypothetical protein